MRARPPTIIPAIAVLTGLALAALVGCGTATPAALRIHGSSAQCRSTAGPMPRPAAGVSVDGNIRYGSHGGQELLLDVYRPSRGHAPRPAVLVVHSGGWAGGDKANYAVWSEDLAKAGFVAFNANYTLAAPGRPGWPLQLDELRSAVRWIRAHAIAYGVDPGRIGALGGSAGANLVELLGDDAHGRCSEGDRVAAVVAWSGPTDLQQFETNAVACLRGQLLCGNPGLVALVPSLLSRYLGCAAAKCPQRWRDASPIHHVSPGASPTLLFNSAQEAVPLDQVKAFSRALAGARVLHQLIVYPGSAHAETYGTNAMPVSIAFLAHYL